MLIIIFFDIESVWIYHWICRMLQYNKTPLLLQVNLLLTIFQGNTITLADACACARADETAPFDEAWEAADAEA